MGEPPSPINTEPWVFQRMVVMEDAKTKSIVATGSIIVEPKFIHQGFLIAKQNNPRAALFRSHSDAVRLPQLVWWVT